MKLFRPSENLEAEGVYLYPDNYILYRLFIKTTSLIYSIIYITFWRNISDFLISVDSRYQLLLSHSTSYTW